jgi:hypothetical protein
MDGPGKRSKSLFKLCIKYAIGMPGDLGSGPCHGILPKKPLAFIERKKLFLLKFQFFEGLLSRTMSGFKIPPNRLSGNSKHPFASTGVAEMLTKADMVMGRGGGGSLNFDAPVFTRQNVDVIPIETHGSDAGFCRRDGHGMAPHGQDLSTSL